MAHRVAPHASADLDDIWVYVAGDSSAEIADYLIDSITDRFSLLARHPYLGRAREEDFGAGARSFPVGEYLVIYCVVNNDVLILRVAHVRREIDGLFGD